MRLLKIWPVLVSALVCSCSLQQHTDRAERSWLKASSLHSALHEVELEPIVNDNRKDELNGPMFSFASGAATFLRGKIQTPQIRELSGLDAIQGLSLIHI